MVELDDRGETTDDGSEDETQADGDADHGHPLRAVLLIGDIRGRGTGDRDVARHHAGDEARDDHDPELSGEDP